MTVRRYLRCILAGGRVDERLSDELAARCSVRDATQGQQHQVRRIRLHDLLKDKALAVWHDGVWVLWVRAGRETLRGSCTVGRLPEHIRYAAAVALGGEYDAEPVRSPYGPPVSSRVERELSQ